MFRAKEDVWLRKMQITRSGRSGGVKSRMWVVIKVGGDDERWVKREREEFLYPNGKRQIKRRARLSRIAARDQRAVRW